MIVPNNLIQSGALETPLCSAFGLKALLLLSYLKKKQILTRLFYKNLSKLLTIYSPVDLMTGCTNDRGQTIMSSLML